MTSTCLCLVIWRTSLRYFCFFLTTQAAFAEVPTEERLRDFNILTENIIQRYKPPGIAIAIVTPKQILSLKTAGVRRLGGSEAINEDTIFRIASVSKACTSAVVAQLVAQGRIDIEDPVLHYLPGVQIANYTHTQKLKLKHLLSHTTGLPAHSLEHEAYRRQDFGVLIKSLKSVRAVNTPGKEHQYQNVLYSLLGPVVENVTQTSFTDYLRESLLEPLGISCYALNEHAYASCGNMAYPHLRSRCDVTSLDNYYRVHESSSYYDNILPAAGMGFSIKDTATLLQAFMGGHPNVLNVKILEKFYAPVVFVSKGTRRCKKRRCKCRKYVTEHFGLGWRIKYLKGRPIIYHGGLVDGYTARIAFSEEEHLGIAILTNANNSLPRRLTSLFFQMLFDKNYHKLDWENWVSRKFRRYAD